MHVIYARNVNDAYVAGMHYMSTHGQAYPSRNGPVKVVPYPVTTVYAKPTERVLFDEQRDANPFFHLFEALWMLDGRNDVKTMDQFLKSFKQFSDDGETYHGAYGYRWRHWPRYEYDRGHPQDGYDQIDFDQLPVAIGMLKKDPPSRRVIIAMWDPTKDLDTQHNDIPCNDLIKLRIVDNALCMQVYCRSNDIVLGCYGANAVHMSMLQEYLAAQIGIAVGTYTQISGDYHAYTERPYTWEKYYPLKDEPREYHEFTTFPLVHTPKEFDAELSQVMRFVEDGSLLDRKLCNYQNPFFQRVVLPMYRAHWFYREKEIDKALDTLAIANASVPNAVPSWSFGARNDWIMAGFEWLLRRDRKKSP